MLGGGGLSTKNVYTTLGPVFISTLRLVVWLYVCVVCVYMYVSHGCDVEFGVLCFIEDIYKTCGSTSPLTMYEDIHI